MRVLEETISWTPVLLFVTTGLFLICESLLELFLLPLLFSSLVVHILWKATFEFFLSSFPFGLSVVFSALSWALNILENSSLFSAFS